MVSADRAVKVPKPSNTNPERAPAGGDSVQVESPAPSLDLTPANVLKLQRTIGNRAVQWLIAAQNPSARVVQRDPSNPEEQNESLEQTDDSLVLTLPRPSTEDGGVSPLEKPPTPAAISLPEANSATRPEAANQSFSPNLPKSMSSDEIGEQIAGGRAALADPNVSMDERRAIRSNINMLETEAYQRGDEMAQTPPTGEAFDLQYPLPGLHGSANLRSWLVQALGTTTIPLSPGYVRSLLERVIGAGGDQKYLQVFNQLSLYLGLAGVSAQQTTDLSGGVFSVQPGLGTNPADTAKQIELGHGVLNLMSDQYELLKKDRQQFTEDFEKTARSLATEVLAKSEEQVRSEMERYGVSNEDFPFPTADAKRPSTLELAQAAGQLLAARKHLQKLRDMRHRAVMTQVEGEDMDWRVDEGYESEEPSIEPNQVVSSFDQQIDLANEQFQALRTEVVTRFPILYSIDDGADSERSLNSIAQGSIGGMLTIGQEVQEKLSSIQDVREELDDDDNLLWKLAPIMEMTKRQMNILPDSVWSRAVADRVAAAQETPWWKTALTVIGIGLTIVAFIPSGGASGVAGAALLTADIAAAALDAYTLYDTAHEYGVQSALTKTSFDRAQALSQEEPSLFWLALSLVGAVTGAGGALRATRNFNRIVAARRMALAATSSEEAAEAALALRRAANEAELSVEETERLVQESQAVSPLSSEIQTVAAQFPRLTARQTGRLNRITALMESHAVDWTDLGIYSEQEAAEFFARYANPDEALAALETQLQRHLDIRGVSSESQLPGSSSDYGDEAAEASGYHEYDDPYVKEGHRMPRATETPTTDVGGMWGGERGNSEWFSDMPEVNAVTNYEPIPFRNGYPDFSKWSRGRVIIQDMSGVDHVDFAQADRIFAQQHGFANQTAVANWRSAQQLTWHHVEDGETMILVPSALHGNVPHVGGASLSRAVP